MKIYFDKKTINLEAKKLGFWGKFSGLMFRSKHTGNLLFEFSPLEISTIHSFFVFFPFLAIWLDEKNSVIESNIVRPFTPAVTPKKRPAKLVELPLNQKNRKIIELLVGKGNI
jgi:uncharacterized membrane protein (UPF0127 family)